MMKFKACRKEFNRFIITKILSVNGFKVFMFMRFTIPTLVLLSTALFGSVSFSCAESASAMGTSTSVGTSAGKTSSTSKILNPNTLLAIVNGEKITVADLQAALATMPPQLRQLPPGMVYPLLLDQLVDQKAILFAAHKEGLDKKPEVQKLMAAAANTALQNAWLSEQVMPHLTDAAIKQYYEQNYANKPPEEEVHARQILVQTKAEAESVIKKLKAGADFAKLAAEVSTDKGNARQSGGDLGWFRKSDMVPAFANAAFSMKKGEISSTPVKSEYGYHVIQVLGTRMVPVPKLDEVKDKIRQILFQKYGREAIEDAMRGVKVERFDPNTGKPLPASPAQAATGSSKK